MSLCCVIDDRFKKTAFQKVAMVISKFPKKITMENLKEVKQLPGVGKASLQKVNRVGSVTGNGLQEKKLQAVRVGLYYFPWMLSKF